jgi:hypothetical protein
MALRYNDKSSSGNANTLASGSVVAGTAVDMGDNARKKVRDLSALVTVLAETSTFTWAGKWQVSNDNSTWVDLTHGSQNAAAVVISTGTAGADSAVSKAFTAPDSIYGWKKARFALVTGGTTGQAADTYAIGYCYRSPG